MSDVAYRNVSVNARYQSHDIILDSSWHRTLVKNNQCFTLSDAFNGFFRALSITVQG